MTKKSQLEDALAEVMLYIWTYVSGGLLTTSIVLQALYPHSAWWTGIVFGAIMSLAAVIMSFLTVVDNGS